jgi:hypothetical protein
MPGIIPDPSDPNQSAYSSIWAGIGLGTSAGDSLLQAGTEQDIDFLGNTTYYAWFELCCSEQNQQQITNLNVRPGDTVDAAVWNLGPNTGYPGKPPTFIWSVYDSTTATGVSGQMTGDSNFTGSGLTSEHIVERTELSPTYPHLADFQTVTADFTQDCEYQNGTNNCYWPGTNGSFSLTMASCNGTTLATPSDLDLSGQFFTVTWDNEGQVDPVGCGG